MKTATIFAIIGLVIQLAWSVINSAMGSVIYEIFGEHTRFVWLFFNLISGVTLLAFFITFLTVYGSNSTSESYSHE